MGILFCSWGNIFMSQDEKEKDKTNSCWNDAPEWSIFYNLDDIFGIINTFQYVRRFLLKSISRVLIFFNGVVMGVERL